MHLTDLASVVWKSETFRMDELGVRCTPGCPWGQKSSRYSVGRTCLLLLCLPSLYPFYRQKCARYFPVTALAITPPSGRVHGRTGSTPHISPSVHALHSRIAELDRHSCTVRSIEVIIWGSIAAKRGKTIVLQAFENNRRSSHFPGGKYGSDTHISLHS